MYWRYAAAGVFAATVEANEQVMRLCHSSEFQWLPVREPRPECRRHADAGVWCVAGQVQPHSGTIDPLAAFGFVSIRCA